MTPRPTPDHLKPHGRKGIPNIGQGDCFFYSILHSLAAMGAWVDEEWKELDHLDLRNITVSCLKARKNEPVDIRGEFTLRN